VAHPLLARRPSRQDKRRLLGHLIETEERERRRVARELHDDLSQDLALLAIELDTLVRRPLPTVGEYGERLRGASTRIRDLSSVVHDLSHRLHPSKLEQLGLVAAVRALSNEFGRHHHLTVRFAHADLPDVIPPSIALCLYRIVQESLRNIVRHGGVDRARVQLAGTPGGIVLRVSDHGVGFDPAAARAAGGLGLVSMRERLHLAGGRLEIDARPGGGTRIEARVPTPPPHHPRPVMEIGSASERPPSCDPTRGAL
jgi:signal transduction histidine kinase